MVEEQVVFGTSGDSRLTDPDVGQRINTMVDKINALPNVTPAGAGALAKVSALAFNS